MSTEKQSTGDLQQQLLELVYGLATDDEAAALQDRIKSDPEVAVAYAEAERMADLLAASARLTAPKVELASPPRPRVVIAADRNGEAALTSRQETPSPLTGEGRSEGEGAVHDTALPLTPGPSPARGEGRLKATSLVPSPVELRISRAMRRTAAIAATLLAAVTLGGYLVASWPLVGVEAKHPRLVVTGPKRLEPGIDNLFTVNATSPTGRPLAAKVSYALRTADGTSLVPSTEASTDRDGRLTVKVRPDLHGESSQQATLEIAAVGTESTEPLKSLLSVEPAGLATQLALDKPIYQPGEIVRYRSLTLTRFGLNPPSEAAVEFEIHDPSGAVVPGSKIEAETEHGVGAGAFPLGGNLAGGEYTLIARSPAHRFADEKRTFIVRHYRLPRLKKDLEFTRDSYSPGEHVVADLSVERTEGSPAAGAKLHGIATVDGQVAAEVNEQIGPAGTARVEFDLPAKIDRGAAQLAVVIDDGGNRETVAKTIRVNLDRVEVSFYPEGGDLVPGLENRVYFTARDPLGKPAHVAGQLVDGDGREVARVETTYKGMGSFKLTPRADAKYTLKADKSLHIRQQPESLVPQPAQHVVLSTGRGVFDAKQPLAVDLESSEDKLPLAVEAFCRGVPVGQQLITAHKGTNHVEIPLPSQVGGVVRVTVFEQGEAAGKQRRAVAERLVYRRPERALNVRIADHQPRYSPGDPVELSLVVTNERGEPTPAALGVSVAPDSLLKMIDDELPSMPTHFYLMTEIEKPEDLEKADFYLSDVPQAPAALDLLLGTQGWRRFAERRVDEFVDAKNDGGQVARLAAFGEIGGTPLVLDNGDKATENYRADLDRLQAKRAEALSVLGRYVLLGALPFALLLLFFAVWGSLGGLRFWLPTVTTATACFAVAWLWSEIASKPSEVAITQLVPVPQPQATREREVESFLLADHNWQFSVPTVFPSRSPGDFRGIHSYYDPSDFRVERDVNHQSPYVIALRRGNNYSAGSTLNSLTLGGGSVSLNGGTLLVYSGGNAASITSASTIDLNGNNSTAGAFAVGNTGIGDGWAVSNDGTNDFGANRSLSSVPSLTKTGTGTLTLNSSGTYARGTTIQMSLIGDAVEVPVDAEGLIDQQIRAAQMQENTRIQSNLWSISGNGQPAVISHFAYSRPVDVSSIPFPDEPPIVYPSAEFWRKLTVDRKKYKSVDINEGGADNHDRRISVVPTFSSIGDAETFNVAQGATPGIYGVQDLVLPYAVAESGRRMSEDRKKYKPVILKAPDEAEARVLKALDEPTEMDFIETPLKDVVEALKILHDIPVDIDVKAITDAGASPDTTITRTVKGISLKSALRLMLQEHDLNFTIDHEVLLITSDKAAKERAKYVYVREYAHHHESSPNGARTDFTETLYWNPLLITDAAGKATIKFDLSDAVAKFRVVVDAHAHTAPAGEGRIGSGTGEVVARLPISLEPKLPLEVNAGDRIDLPVAVVNDTDGELPVALALNVPSASESHEIISPTVPKLLEVDGSPAQQVRLPAGGRTRAYFPLNVTGAAGTAQVEVRGQADKLADAKRQTLTVVAAGYPVAASYGGNLSGEIALTVRIPKPADMVAGSLHVRLTAYPSAIGQLEDGFESILREPNGCFEQASTENYPNVLALEYLQEHKLANPELTRRCKALLQSGYARLTSYESKSGGFEWFGGDPGHETLTAYGLMEFHEMARVYPVDPALLKRTTEWLLSRRDGSGGFKRSQSGHQFGFGSPELNDAYITWALTEAGVTGIEPEIKHAIAVGRKSEDPYIIALASITALNAGDAAAGRELLDWLVKLQAADGHLDGRESFAHSGGESLQVETTALAALAWLKSTAYSPKARKAIDWLVAHRQGSGGFGSTQATILALKALVEHARLNHKTVTGGELLVKRDGQSIGRRAFAAGDQGLIRIDDLASKLEPGENHLTISLTGENQMPYSLEVSYRSFTGASDPACAVRLSTKLAVSEVKAGETVALDAELANATDKPQPMTVAILGLPAGLQPRAKQLDDLKKSGAIDFYETRPREIVCYWRSLTAGQKIPLHLDLVAEFPGHYTAPASRAYLYYTAERKQWAEPLRIAVTRE